MTVLDLEFQKTQKSLTPGKLFLYVGYLDKSGREYGSFEYVTKETLMGRKFEVTKFQSGRIRLLVTDTKFDPHVWKAINPLGTKE